MTGYRDKDTLERKYVDERKSAREIADEFGVSHPTILDWLDRHEIERRDRAEAIREAVSEPSVPLRTNRRGYEKWSGSGDRSEVAVHRLAAVAWFGWDAVIGIDVHHPNGVPWDNREGNLEPVGHAEHARLHRRERAW